MKVALLTEVRVYKVGNNYYTTGPFRKILERYFKTFGKVDLITRVLKSEKLPSGCSEINNYCNKVVGFSSLVRVLLPFFRSDIRNIIDNSDVVIMRLPSLISMRLYKCVKDCGKKYMVEVVGCVWDAYWNHGLSGKILAPYCFLKMKHIIRKADYATYVTSVFLQDRYPCEGKKVSVSDVDIKKVYKAKDYEEISKKKRFSLLTAAGVNVRYKGQQYTIKAIKILNNMGLRIDYYLAGDGDQGYLRRVAVRNHVENQIHFLGALSHDELLEEMRGVDFYIQPSLQEGLPRSVVEAMSCGTICLGAKTGGIPELLNDAQIFERKNPKAIARAILATISSDDLNNLSIQNVKKSKAFLSDLLDKKRIEFFQNVVKGGIK